MDDQDLPVEPEVVDPWANIRKRPKAKPKTGRSQDKQAQARRDQFLELVKNGRTLTEACNEIGIQRSTYERWRERWIDFRNELDWIRSQQGRKNYRGTEQLDFVKFRRDYLKYETFPHQQRMVKVIEGAAPQSVSMVLLPPEHGKTTLIEDWITYKLCVDPNTRITIVSEGQPHARKIMRRVQARLSDPMSKIWAQFGPFYEPGQERRGKPWSSDFFTVFKADHDERDYSLECRGWRSAVAGTRTDYLIIDDVTSMKNHGQAADIVATLRQDFFTRPGKEGHTIIVGTRVAANDVYEQLQDAETIDGEPLITGSVVLPAIDHEGKALCPQMWDETQLARKRAIVGEAVWWRNYQQKPRAAGDLTFSEEVINKAKNEFLELDTPIVGGHTILGLDPALGGGNSFTAWSYDDKMMRVLNWRREWGLARTEDILALVDEMAQKYARLGAPVEDLVMEFNNFQRGLGRDDRMIEIANRHGFRILPHTTGGGGNSKLDEILGIGALATDMSKGEIEIPWAPSARDHMSHFNAEFMAWMPRKSGKELRQDLVMSSWFPWIVMKNRRKVLETVANTDGWKRQAMPFRPMSYQKAGFYK